MLLSCLHLIRPLSTGFQILFTCELLALRHTQDSCLTIPAIPAAGGFPGGRWSSSPHSRASFLMAVEFLPLSIFLIMQLSQPSQLPAQATVDMTAGPGEAKLWSTEFQQKEGMSLKTASSTTDPALKPM